MSTEFQGLLPALLLASVLISGSAAVLAIFDGGTKRACVVSFSIFSLCLFIFFAELCYEPAITAREVLKCVGAILITPALAITALVLGAFIKFLSH